MNRFKCIHSINEYNRFTRDNVEEVKQKSHMGDLYTLTPRTKHQYIRKLLTKKENKQYKNGIDT